MGSKSTFKFCDRVLLAEGKKVDSVLLYFENLRKSHCISLKKIHFFAL